MKQSRFVISVFLSATILASCSTAHKNAQTTATAALVTDGKLWSALFQQKAAEYAALCHQAFNGARYSLDETMKIIKSSKPLAIITDIDETLLDNSPYAVHQSLHNKDYESQSWYEWTGKASAKPIPGSLDFFNYAASKNVAVFYVTNRDEKERTATLENLKKYHFPYADNEHLLLKSATSSKEERRNYIAEKYTVIQYLGDNLSDFSTLWDKQSTAQRMENVNRNAAEFGKRFIIIPNFTYGGWEDAIYGNQHTLSPAAKDSAIKANVIGY